MHLGNALSALLAWLGARSAGGSMVLRIEDLDPRCHKPALTDQLIDDLTWLGLDWDQGPLRQTRRTAAYEEALAQLAQADLVYPCFCTRAQLHAASAPHASDGTFVYPGTCRALTAAEVAQKSLHRAPAWRLRVPDAQDPAGTLVVPDLVRPAVAQVLARDVGDFLVRRSDGVFAYQLAVVVDDAAQGVTQVVRGLDLQGSSPRQRYLQRMLGLPPVTYAHVPLLTAPDGRRLSKRDRDLDLGALRARGVRPEQVVGLLAWAAGLRDEPAACPARDLVEGFAWKAVARRPAALTVDARFMERLL